MKTIAVDYEHNCETWWDAARIEAKGNPPSACVGLIWDVDTLTVPDEDAAEFLLWAEKIDGWDEGPFVVNDNGDGTRASLMNYNTAEEIRTATAEELAASIEAAQYDGGAGVISVEIDGSNVSCYVVE